MTKLFEEYEFNRLALKNADLLIGRKFYWSMDDFTGEKISRKQINEFEVVKIITDNSSFYPCSATNPYCNYRYLHYGQSNATRPLIEVIRGATEILD